MLHEFVELLSRLGDRGRLEVEYEGRSKLHRSSQRRYRKRHGPYRGEQRAALVGDVRRVGADGCGRLGRDVRDPALTTSSGACARSERPSKRTSPPVAEIIPET
jgi:hypothetical protein